MTYDQEVELRLAVRKLAQGMEDDETARIPDACPLCGGAMRIRVTAPSVLGVCERCENMAFVKNKYLKDDGWA